LNEKKGAFLAYGYPTLNRAVSDDLKGFKRAFNQPDMNTKIVTIDGQPVELYSDNGSDWFSRPADLEAYQRFRETRRRTIVELCRWLRESPASGVCARSKL
jgi:hypothetical protein